MVDAISLRDTARVLAATSVNHRLKASDRPQRDASSACEAASSSGWGDLKLASMSESDQLELRRDSGTLNPAGSGMPVVVAAEAERSQTKCLFTSSLTCQLYMTTV